MVAQPSLVAVITRHNWPASARTSYRRRRDMPAPPAAVACVALFSDNGHLPEVVNWSWVSSVG